MVTLNIDGREYDCTPKEKAVSKDCEILKGCSDDKSVHVWTYNYESAPHSCETCGCKIHSVRRLSDDAVFTVGDHIELGWHNISGLIQSFQIEKPHFMCANIYSNEQNKTYLFNIGWLAKPTQLKSTKPPLGIIPEKLWKKNRMYELSEAINRYFDIGKPIPQEWLDELHRLHFKEDPVSADIKYDLHTFRSPVEPTYQSHIPTQSKQEKERIEVRVHRENSWLSNEGALPITYYEFNTKKEIPKEKFPALKAAIELVLNDQGITDESITDWNQFMKALGYLPTYVKQSEK